MNQARLFDRTPVMVKPEVAKKVLAEKVAELKERIETKVQPVVAGEVVSLEDWPEFAEREGVQSTRSEFRENGEWVVIKTR